MMFLLNWMLFRFDVNGCTPRTTECPLKSEWPIRNTCSKLEPLIFGGQVSFPESSGIATYLRLSHSCNTDKRRVTSMRLYLYSSGTLQTNTRLNNLGSPLSCKSLSNGS